MLTLKLKDKHVEFTFINFQTKEIIHSETFGIKECEQIALDLLGMVAVTKENGEKRVQSRCF